MKKTIIDQVKERLTEGLEIASIEEAQNKYKLVFEYKGTKTWADISKMCSLDEVDKVIKTAMFTIYINRGEFEEARRTAAQIIAE